MPKFKLGDLVCLAYHSYVYVIVTNHATGDGNGSWTFTYDGISQNGQSSFKNYDESILLPYVAIPHCPPPSAPMLSPRIEGAALKELDEMDNWYLGMPQNVPSKPKCVCGAHKVKDSAHSSWCDIK